MGSQNLIILFCAQVLSKIPKRSEMNPEGKAALLGFRGEFYRLYHPCGSKRALDFFTEAIELDPDESLWYFRKAKTLRLVKSAKSYFASNEEEIELVERAIKLRRSVTYIIWLVEMYRHLGQITSKEPDNKKRDLWELNTKILDLCK